MAQENYHCKRCQRLLGVIVDGLVLKIAGVVSIISVTKLRCDACKAQHTFRPSRKDAHTSCTVATS